MTAEAARGSAYAELVAGLLDVRSGAPEAEFDAVLATAEAAGRIDAATARALRWCQRESVRGVVEHAQAVLPATLLALEQALASANAGAGANAGASANAGAGATAATSDEIVDHDEPDDHDDLAEPDDHAPPVDLTARRLLVAGLTPLRDP